MIPPSEYDRLCDQLVTLYSDLENSIISDITRRILKTGRITESAEWQIKQLQESGMLYDDILAEIAKRTDATSQHVKALFEDAGVQSIRNDNRYYRAAGLAGIVKMSDAALQTLNAGYLKCGGNLQNLTMTTAVTSQTAYINACNQAYMQVTSGAFDYNTAIRNAIKSVTVEGTHVLYPTGHSDRIDVAVRRAVLTGVGQTVRKLSVINAEDMGCDIMEITAHSGARPSHAVWQGQLVSLSGKNAGRVIDGRKVLSLKDIGYGSGNGFGGWNCRHDWYPFFEGISHRAYSDERLKQLDEKNIEYNGKKYSEYEISQIQRRYEREIRAAKREQVAFQTAVQEAGDPELKAVMQDSLNYANDVVKQKQAKMRDFIKQTGQFRDYSREQNYGKVSYNYSHSDSDFSGKMKNILTGKKYMNVVNDFAESLPNIENKKVLSILEKAYNNVTFEKSLIKKSYFNHTENKIYLAKSATPSTVSHELFHKVDHDNKITLSGLLDKCLSSDYENIKKISENAGLSIEDMLYLNYPEAFDKKEIMKEEYRGFSDIIHGMTRSLIMTVAEAFLLTLWTTRRLSEFHSVCFHQVLSETRLYPKWTLTVLRNMQEHRGLRSNPKILLRVRACAVQLLLQTSFSTRQKSVQRDEFYLSRRHFTILFSPLIRTNQRLCLRDFQRL